jgi:hypothetical protein
LSEPQSLNAYVYVQNLPTSLIDPTGMVECYGAGSEYCEGPGGRLMEDSAGTRDPNAICTDDPHACELCADNPGIFNACSYSDPNTGGSGMGDSGGGVLGDTGTSGFSAPPNPPTVEATTTPTIEVDTASTGSGGALPGQIGEQGRHLFNEVDHGYEPQYTEVQKTFIDPATGRIGRVDYYYNDGQTRLIDEVNGGYVSGEYYQNQALKYQRIADAQGATLRYFLCGGVSGPFEGFLVANEIGIQRLARVGKK